jgi:hypothetical protein
VAPSRRSSSRSRFETGAGDAQIAEKLGVADSHLSAADHPGDALPGDGAKLGDVLQRLASLLGGSDDHGGERVLARSFETCTERQDRGFVEAFGRDDGDDPAASLRSVYDERRSSRSAPAPRHS